MRSAAKLLSGGARKYSPASTLTATAARAGRRPPVTATPATTSIIKNRPPASPKDDLKGSVTSPRSAGPATANNHAVTLRLDDRCLEEAPTKPPSALTAVSVADGYSRREMSRTRVVVAEDEILLREGLGSLLERSGFEVVGQCGDGVQLIDLVREQRPQLALIDIRMPPTHTTEGLDAARTIREEFPQTAILVLSAHVEVEHAMDLLASGQGSGYLLKSRVTDVAEFTETLERVVKGGSVVDPALVQELVAARRADDPLEEITPRERDVLSLMAEGRSNAGIAHALWVTEGTVEKHVHSILGKLPLPDTHDDHRRVLAVLAFLEAR
jgi:DNA-binding NarL/FixJ family response regulator